VKSIWIYYWEFDKEPRAELKRGKEWYREVGTERKRSIMTGSRWD